MLATLSKSQLNRGIFYLALAALLVAGLWLRWRFIHTVQPFPDEFVTLLAVQMIGEKGLPIMPSGLFYDHGLLFTYVGSLASFLGPIRLAVRYASLVFGLLTVVLTFFVGRRWFSPAVGLIAATGLAIAPAAIQWSGRARMYALLQLLVLVTLWLAYEGIAADKARWRWAVLLTFLAATLTHFAAVTLAPPLVLAAIIFWSLSDKATTQDSEQAARKFTWQWLTDWRRWLEGVALAGVLIVAFLVKRAGQPKGIEALEPTNAVNGLAQVLTIYADVSLNFIGGWQAISPFYLTLPALIFVPFMLVAVALALWQSGRVASRTATVRPGSRPSLFLAIILVTTTLEMIIFVSPDRKDDKYLFMLLPVLFLLGAQGLGLVGNYLVGGDDRWSAHAPQSSTSNLLSRITPIIVASLIIIITQPAIRALLANTGDDYDAAFAYVRNHWQAGDKILTGTPAAAAFYLDRNDFYSVQRRGGYDYRILTVDGQAVDRWLASPAIRTETALHQTLAEQEVWLVLERWGLQREYYDLPFQQQLLAQTDHVSDTQGIFILRSRPNPRPLAPEPAHPVEAVFANLVRLEGYTLEPDRPAPGQTVRLTLYWQTLAPMTRDYTVFVHLRQPDAGNVAQADHRPLGKIYPTSLWPVGATIRESSELSLPPDLSPGGYELWVGLYLLETGERLPVQHDTSGENAVRLGQVRVGQ